MWNYFEQAGPEYHVSSDLPDFHAPAYKQVPGDNFSFDAKAEPIEHMKWEWAYDTMHPHQESVVETKENPFAFMGLRKEYIEAYNSVYYKYNLEGTTDADFMRANLQQEIGETNGNLYPNDLSLQRANQDTGIPIDDLKGVHSSAMTKEEGLKELLSKFHAAKKEAVVNKSELQVGIKKHEDKVKAALHVTPIQVTEKPKKAAVTNKPIKVKPIKSSHKNTNNEPPDHYMWGDTLLTADALDNLKHLASLMGTGIGNLVSMVSKAKSGKEIQTKVKQEIAKEQEEVKTKPWEYQPKQPTKKEENQLLKWLTNAFKTHKNFRNSNIEPMESQPIASSPRTASPKRAPSPNGSPVVKSEVIDLTHSPAPTPKASPKRAKKKEVAAAEPMARRTMTRGTNLPIRYAGGELGKGIPSRKKKMD